MKKFSSTVVLVFMFAMLTFGQEITQTVRGTLLDTDSKLPLTGVEVTILGSDPKIVTLTDDKGIFRFENMPIGRITLQLAYLGYDKISIPNIEVNSGKEVVLTISMQESVVEMDEVVVKANKDKGAALNDMSLVGTRSISVEDSKRYASSYNDPSRILSNFAGVATQDASNDIIVRGNSPKYVQWRLEGIEITNPNHFSDQNAISGGLSTINNDLLSTSDFHTGAFSPEYGDVLSGVYDVNLRAGNNEKTEAALGLGIIGTNLTVEGPFKKGYGGSYLVNYRYSTVAIITGLGLLDVGGTPKFQDGAFKIVLPTKKVGTFSLFGLGGISKFLVKDIQPNIFDTPGNRGMNTEISEDYDKGSNLFNLGLNHTISLNANSFIKTSVSYSENSISDDVYETKTIKLYNGSGVFLRDSITDQMPNFNSRLNKSTYRAGITYNNKLNSKNKIQVGVKYALFGYDYNQSQIQYDSIGRVTAVDFNEQVGTFRTFISLKKRLTHNITVVAGFHNMNVLFNNKSTLEPRVALKWKLNNKNSVNAGYGNHSSMESIHNYFAKITLQDGSVVEPNKDLGLLKAHHFVLGYEKRFTDNLLLKVEGYYQHLYNLPVENNDTSYYATINEGVEFRYVDLVNKGTGKNYGIEFTLERFFNKNYYFLINGSLYNSNYKSLEGIERNTQYNGNYLANILCGKEFQNLGKKKNQTLALNAKLFFGGGKKILPLLKDDQGNAAVDPANGKYWDYKKAYNDKLQDTYQLTLSASYKFNRKRTTHELFINLENITNAKGKLSEHYDESKPKSIGYVTQFGLFPNLMYRVCL